MFDALEQKFKESAEDCAKGDSNAIDNSNHKQSIGRKTEQEIIKLYEGTELVRYVHNLISQTPKSAQTMGTYLKYICLIITGLEGSKILINKQRNLPFKKYNTFKSVAL